MLLFSDILARPSPMLFKSHFNFLTPGWAAFIPKLMDRQDCTAGVSCCARAHVNHWKMRWAAPAWSDVWWSKSWASHKLSSWRSLLWLTSTAARSTTVAGQQGVLFAMDGGLPPPCARPLWAQVCVADISVLHTSPVEVSVMSVSVIQCAVMPL